MKSRLAWEEESDSVTTRQEFRPMAGWHQVHLKDETSEDDLSSGWTPEAVERLLVVGNRSLGIGTYRDADVPFAVEVYDARPPAVTPGTWDRVNEASIEVPSGTVVLWGCGEYWPTSPRISVKPGWYRARICYGGKNTLSEDELDGDDHYEVSLWPEPPSAITELKNSNL